MNLAKVIFMLKHSVKLRRYFTECFNVNIIKPGSVQVPWWWSKTETCRNDILCVF